MSENPTFDSKQATIEYLRNTIVSGLEPLLEGSPLRVGVYDSPKTNSKYVNLYYANRSENPDPERLPYTVRLSDHDQTYLFRANRPNACFQVKPILTQADQRQREKTTWLYEYLSLSLQDSRITKETRHKLIRLREQCVSMLTAHQKRLSYTYSGNLRAAMSAMCTIIHYSKQNRSAPEQARSGQTRRGDAPPSENLLETCLKANLLPLYAN